MREASEWLVGLDDDLTAAQISEWLEWSQAHPGNLDAFDDLKSLLEGIRGLDRSHKAAALRELIAPTEIAASPSSRLPKLARLRYVLAASVAACVIATGYLLYADRGAGRPLTRVHLTAKAEMQAFELPDGTQVQLGPLSRLDVSFTRHARVVKLLSGEAFFDVETDARRPFLVRAGAWRLTDIGTAFNVRKTEEHVVVIVTQGIVDIMKEPRTGAAGTQFVPQPLRIVAGEQAVAVTRERAISVSKVDAGSATSWQRGQLRFQDEPLGVVIANLNRYSEREILIADPEVAQMTFSGTVLVDNIDGWLTGVCSVFGLRELRDGDGRVVLHRSALADQ
jgi:transmembrane sensor